MTIGRELVTRGCTKEVIQYADLPDNIKILIFILKGVRFIVLRYGLSRQEVINLLR